MPLTIDLEREFFKAAKEFGTYSTAKRQFMKQVKQISETWIDDKFRLGVLGLNNQAQK